MTRLLLAITILAASAWAGPSAVHAQELRLDPDKVMGPTACGDCHEASIAAWRDTHHFSTFKDMPRTAEARDIADKLDIKRIKAEGECVSCHFTSKMEDGDVDTIGGITCESCHGAGKDWIEIHSDFGGKDATAENESEAHRTQRWAKSEAAGMIRPGDLYKLAENCYQCHTVPKENLVNTGGHPAGSNFELVAWSQGEVRHNVWYNDGAGNAEASQNRKRVMFLVGQALDLEYALRGVAKATQKAQYAVQMAKRAKRSALRIKAISDAGVSIPEVGELLKIAGSAKVSLNNEAALTAAADKVAVQAKAIASNYDGSELAALDGLLPSADAYKGTVYAP
ncbi:multiheme c-type cytochrome [Abyssibacter sp.]|jgi:hypothetical protein|uniref:multiheme c-type cytochrome n=1 Tax=Abyssibacter sp. TaxID=2320200 RepID=UPI000C3771AB|nr:multiheme c-type cytochrome [Abyssibacter sp.]MBB86074.1 hypothetical protein [Xanthomonadales bacterium]MCK5859871.1 hypothetical protein [Abyssibacter sp.]